MKPELQLKACAELDGIEIDSSAGNFRWRSGPDYSWNAFDLPNYFTYDEIIPLVQTQPREIQDRIFCFWAVTWQLNKTPHEIVEALLRATGKWIEDET